MPVTLPEQIEFGLISTEISSRMPEPVHNDVSLESYLEDYPVLKAKRDAAAARLAALAPQSN
jgi:hypothetical protein